MKNGLVCRFRHLDACHPEAIADRFKNGLLSKEEIVHYGLYPCGPNESNPFASPESKICFDYLNHHVCSRNYSMRICRFRHLEANHPDAIQDRKRLMKDVEAY